MFDPVLLPTPMEGPEKYKGDAGGGAGYFWVCGSGGRVGWLEGCWFDPQLLLAECLILSPCVVDSAVGV